jgi:hypothetical protein
MAKMPELCIAASLTPQVLEPSVSIDDVGIILIMDVLRVDAEECEQLRRCGVLLFYKE